MRVVRTTFVAAGAGAVFVAATATSGLAATTLGPSTWTSTGTGTTTPAPAERQWNVASNWSTNPDHPSGIGASALFTTGPTANRSIVFIDDIVLGSLSVDNTTTASTTLTGSTAGGGGSLTFEVASGSASLIVNGTGGQTNTAGSLTLQSVTLNDDLIATVNQTNQSSTAGALQLTATLTGTGGFTKAGDGLATFGNAGKTYSGATVLSGGRLRMSLAGRPDSTSSFTINGGQLTPISAGSYTLGASAATPLNLNGNGATSGPFAAFGGAIRPDRGLAITITNNVNLQSNSVIHMQANTNTGATASPVGEITLSGVVSGVGQLRFTAANSDVEQGLLILTNDNDYSGGTLVAGGIVRVSGNGDFGTGDVTVSNATSTSSIARIDIQSTTSDAIDDLATLSLAGGGTGGVADQNFAILGTGINEVVGGLILGGVTQTQIGSYGATGSGATFVFDEYFSGLGVVSLVPEPGSLAFVGLAGLGFLRRRPR